MAVAVSRSVTTGTVGVRLRGAPGWLQPTGREKTHVEIAVVFGSRERDPAQFRTGRAMRNRALVLSIFVATIIPAAAQLVPSWQISDESWLCTNGCQPGQVDKPAHIVQSGSNFTLTSEVGGTAGGVFKGDHTIEVPAWGLTASVSSDLKKVAFSNGTIWSRPDILIEARNLHHANNPAALERWWQDVEDTAGIGEAVASAYGCVGCVTAFYKAVNNVVHFSNGPQDFSGAIQSPVGYTICRANVMNPSVNCNGTFTGSYRTADDPNSASIDGLHWYIVVPPPGLFQDACWANGTVVVEFARATPDNPARSKCGKSGTVAFHYGK